MRVTVIGGSGHIGTPLTPRLVEAGHRVTCVSLSNRQPYTPHTAWRDVECVTLDRASDDFGTAIVALRPEVPIDLISYTLEPSCMLLRIIQVLLQR